jgi:hypothetical protein
MTVSNNGSVAKKLSAVKCAAKWKRLGIPALYHDSFIAD